MKVREYKKERRDSLRDAIPDQIGDFKFKPGEKEGLFSKDPKLINARSVNSFIEGVIGKPLSGKKYEVMGSLLGEINKNLEKNNFGDITKIMEFVKDKENSEYFSGKYGKEVLNKLNESQTLMINNILNGNTDNIPDSYKTKVDDIMKKKNKKKKKKKKHWW